MEARPRVHGAEERFRRWSNAEAIVAAPDTRPEFGNDAAVRGWRAGSAICPGVDVEIAVRTDDDVCLGRREAGPTQENIPSVARFRPRQKVPGACDCRSTIGPQSHSVKWRSVGPGRAAPGGGRKQPHRRRRRLSIPPDPVRRSHRTTEIRPARPPAHAAQHTGARIVAKFLLNYHGGKLADTPEGQAKAMAAWNDLVRAAGQRARRRRQPCRGDEDRQGRRFRVRRRLGPVHRLFDHPGQLHRRGRQGVADVPRPGDRRQRRDRAAARDHVVPGFGRISERVVGPPAARSLRYRAGSRLGT